MMRGFEERVIMFAWHYALLTYMESYKHDQTNLDVLFDDLDDDIHRHFLNINLEVHNRIGHDDLKWERFINGMLQRTIQSVSAIGDYLRFALFRGVDPYSDFHMQFEGFNAMTCTIYISHSEGYDE